MSVDVSKYTGYVVLAPNPTGLAMSKYTAYVVMKTGAVTSSGAFRPVIIT